MANEFRCDQCGTVSDEKPTIIRFSYKLVDGKDGVELIYLCSACDGTLPKTNPIRRSKLVQLFQSMYPNLELMPERPLP
jgi:hypothetical protein